MKKYIIPFVISVAVLIIIFIAFGAYTHSLNLVQKVLDKADKGTALLIIIFLGLPLLLIAFIPVLMIELAVLYLILGIVGVLFACDGNYPKLYKYFRAFFIINTIFLTLLGYTDIVVIGAYCDGLVKSVSAPFIIFAVLINAAFISAQVTCVRTKRKLKKTLYS